MPLVTQVDFGTMYLDPNAFVASAAIFGVDKALPDDIDVIKAQLAAASRWIEAETGKSYVPDEDQTEQHEWDPITRRIAVNNPPVMSISSYKIYTGVSTFATFATTSLVINNQVNYVELTSLAAAASLTPGLLALGLTTPFVQIVYKSYGAVKANIKLVTGYVAARLMNTAFIDAQLPPGIKSIKIGSAAQIEKYPMSIGDMPSVVRTLLQSEYQIGIA